MARSQCIFVVLVALLCLSGQSLSTLDGDFPSFLDARPGSAIAPPSFTASERIGARLADKVHGIVVADRPCSFDPDSLVSDCQCTHSAVDMLNEELLHEALASLTVSRAFRYFKVRLACGCDFELLNDEGAKCRSRHCAVCECPSGSVPELPWLRAAPAGGGAYGLGEGMRIDDSGEKETDLSLDPPELPGTSEPHGIGAPASSGIGILPIEDCTEFVESADRLAAVQHGGSDGRRPARHELGWCAGQDNPWTAEDESNMDNEEVMTGERNEHASPSVGDGEHRPALYVDLLANPEGYTGYEGERAHLIWDAIYSQNCFQDAYAITESDTCTEKRVLYRLISGMHTSITAHIAARYPIGTVPDGVSESEAIKNFGPIGTEVDEYGTIWGYNLDIFHERIANHPDRVENLYFLYLFMLRALMKARDQLIEMFFETGDANEDYRTRRLIHEIITDARLHEACPMPFDEASLWMGDASGEKRLELMGHFRNITKIIDCTSCEKCRLWGKLQVLGIAASMKVLFSETNGASEVDEPFSLERNEIIALINSLGRFSSALSDIKYMESLALADRGSSMNVSGEAAENVLQEEL